MITVIVRATQADSRHLMTTGRWVGDELDRVSRREMYALAFAGPVKLITSYGRFRTDLLDVARPGKIKTRRAKTATKRRASTRDH